MADPDDFYIAWDGARYDGLPPAGWYLAADNRWWPSQDMIRAGNAAPLGDRQGHDGGDGHGFGRAADDGARTGHGTIPGQDVAPPGDHGRPPEPPPPTTPTAPTTPDSWAPERAPMGGTDWQPPAPHRRPGSETAGPPPTATNSPSAVTADAAAAAVHPVGASPIGGRWKGAGAPPGGTTPPRAGNPTGSVGRSRRPRGRRFRPGFIIPILFFALFRCGTGSFESAPALEPLPTIGGIPTVVPTTTVAPVTAESPAREVFQIDDLQVRILGCISGSLTGDVTNTGTASATFDTSFEIEPTDGTVLADGNTATADKTIGPLDPDTAELLILPLTGELAGVESCNVQSISVSNS